MKKNLLFLILLFVMMISTLKGVLASVTMNEKYQSIPNVYIWKTDPTGQRDAISHQMTMIVRNDNHQFVYCIEPGTSIDGTHLYTPYSTDQSYVSGMQDWQWKKIELLAYYGYNYVDENTDHTDIKWYAVTQYLIWKTVPHGYNIYFAAGIHDGTKVTKFSSEITELENLVSMHQITPRFEQKNLNLLLGDTVTLEDKNGVLSQYELESDTPEYITKDGNSITIKANEVGTHHFTLIKKDQKYNHGAIVYIHPESQDVMEVGSFPTIEATYEFQVVGTQLILNKYDSVSHECHSKGSSDIKGATYSLYKKDGTFLQELVIDESCTAQTDFTLGIGDYYLVETKAPKGYQKDNEKHEFSITKANISKPRNVLVYDDYHYSKIKVEKLEKNTGKKIKQAHIAFKIYDTIEQEYICSTDDCIYYTDEEGEFLSGSLYPSTYRLEEVSNHFDGFLWNPNSLEFVVDENSPDVISLSFTNEAIKGGIKIYKHNEAGEALEGVTFEVRASVDLYDVDGTLLYHQNDVVGTLKTNQDGYASISDLPLGHYYVQEIETNEGYFLPDQTFEVFLTQKNDNESVFYETLDIINYVIPNTFKNSHFTAWGIVCMGLGGIFLYEKKNTRDSNVN